MNRIILCLFFILTLLPGAARAAWVDDDFDSDTTNLSLWSIVSIGDDYDRLQVYQSDDVLKFTSSGWSDTGYTPFAGYISNWSVLLSDDFEFTVDYHYSHTGDSDLDIAGIAFGLGNMEAGLSKQTINAGNQQLTEGYQVEGTLYGTPVFGGPYFRGSDDGTLVISYNAADDVLSLLAYEEGTEPVVDWSKTDVGLRDDLGINELYVGLGLWSSGAAISDGEACFDNFAMTKGVVTPEPLGCSLFALGGIVLAFLRCRCKRRRT